MNDIINQINVNKGDSDPSVELVTPFDVTNKLGNNLDDATANDYIFEAVKTRSAVDEIIDREGTPVEVGGSFQFHFMRMKSKYDHATGNFLDVVQLQVFQQGFMTSDGNDFQNIPQVTLTKPLLSPTTRANTLELDSSLETEKGTNLMAMGSKGGGTYPIDYAKHLGAKTVFEGAGIWTDGRTYVIGQIVSFEFGTSGFQTFECIQDNTANLGVNDPTTGLGTFWVGALSFEIPPTWEVGLNVIPTQGINHNEIAYEAIVAHTTSLANEPPNTEFWTRNSWRPTTEYSPLTKDKAQYWINAMGGSKHASTNNGKTAMIDPSVIVRDGLHPRTWVDQVTNDSANLSSDLLQNGAPFDGLRVLCINPATGDPNDGAFGDFAGNDPSGQLKAGNVLEYRDPELTNPSTTGTWFVFRDASQSDYEVYDYEESDSWTHNPCEGTGLGVNRNGACVNLITGSPQTRQLIWKKGAYGLSESAEGKGGIWFADKQFECVHSVKWDSINLRVDMGNENIQGLDELNSSTSAVFVKSEPTDTSRVFPFFVGLNFAFPWPRQNTGVPFGAVSIGEQINLPMLDLDNMHLATDRSREWYGPRVEDFFPLQDISFFQFLRDQTPIDPLVDVTFNVPRRSADYSMAVWMADRADTVIIMEYNFSHNDNTFPQSASISKQKIYRAVPGVSAWIAAQQPEVLDIFDFRNVVRGGIYTRDSFDEQNRYLGARSRFGLTDLAVTNELKLSIDAFRFTKPLICTNADESDAKN